MNLLLVVLSVLYVGGVWRFWSKFKLTNYRASFLFRFILSLLWPPLLLVSKSYRRNFRRTLQG